MKTKALIGFAILAMVSFSSMAQEKEKRFGLELSTGASFGLNELNGASLNPGFGFEGSLHYRFMPHLGIYAGWGWNRFGADNSFAGKDVCFEETGYVFGLQFKHPIGNAPVSYYLRAAGLYNHIETENAGGDIINDSGHGLGYQLAGGIELSLGKKWSLAPGLKFNSLSRNTDYEEVSMNLDHNYLQVRVGILKKF